MSPQTNFVTRAGWEALLRRYGTAYAELQMVGERPSIAEQREAHAYWSEALASTKRQLELYCNIHEREA